jgi:hypothetical protein
MCQLELTAQVARAAQRAAQTARAAQAAALTASRVARTQRSSRASCKHTRSCAPWSKSAFAPRIQCRPTNAIPSSSRCGSNRAGRPISQPPHPQPTPPPGPIRPCTFPAAEPGLVSILSCALLWQLRFSSSILAAADRNGLAGWRSLALPCVDVGSLQKLLPSDHDDALVHELVRKQDLHSRPVPWPPLSPSRRYAAALTRRYRVESWFRRMKCF